MIFKKIDSSEIVADYIYANLVTHLATGKKVLWLMPGGSSISIAQLVLAMLQNVDCSQLAISLTDERFGPVGHQDENWAALLNNTPTPKDATLAPVNTGEDLEQTTVAYIATLQHLIDWADYRLGFFGIGPDGHTAGILPGSSAVESLELAASYDAGQYKRITMTPAAIARLDQAVVYAAGEAKHDALNRLAQTFNLNELPAQALKSVGQLVIFNDYKGDPE